MNRLGIEVGLILGSKCVVCNLDFQNLSHCQCKYSNGRNALPAVYYSRKFFKVMMVENLLQFTSVGVAKKVLPYF
jgi:hypothetical protein